MDVNRTHIRSHDTLSCSTYPGICYPILSCYSLWRLQCSLLEKNLIARSDRLAAGRPPPARDFSKNQRQRGRSRGGRTADGGRAAGRRNFGRVAETRAEGGLLKWRPADRRLDGGCPPAVYGQNHLHDRFLGSNAGS